MYFNKRCRVRVHTHACILFRAILDACALPNPTCPPSHSLVRLPWYLASFHSLCCFSWNLPPLLAHVFTWVPFNVCVYVAVLLPPLSALTAPENCAFCSRLSASPWNSPGVSRQGIKDGMGLPLPRENQVF